MHYIIVLLFLLIVFFYYKKKVLFSEFVFITAIVYPILPYTFYAGKVIGSIEIFGCIIILYLLSNIALYPNKVRVTKFVLLLILFSLCAIFSIHIDFDVFKWFLRLIIFTSTLILLARVFTNNFLKVHSLIKYSVLFSMIIVAEFLFERFYFIIDWSSYWNYKSSLALIGLMPMKVLQVNVGGWATYPVVRTGGLLGFDGATAGLYFGVIFFMTRSLKKSKKLILYQLILVFCIIGSLSRIAIFSFFITYLIMIFKQRKYITLIIITLFIAQGSRYIKYNLEDTTNPLSYIVKRASGQTRDSYGLQAKGNRALRVFGMFSNNQILPAILVGDARLVNKAYGGDNPHNGYIQILFSTGLIGLVLFLLLLYKPTKFFLFQNHSLRTSFGSILILFIIHNIGASYFFQLKEMFVILPPLAVYLSSIHQKTDYRLVYNANEFQGSIN